MPCHDFGLLGIKTPNSGDTLPIPINQHGTSIRELPSAHSFHCKIIPTNILSE